MPQKYASAMPYLQSSVHQEFKGVGLICGGGVIVNKFCSTVLGLSAEFVLEIKTYIPYRNCIAYEVKYQKIVRNRMLPKVLLLVSKCFFIKMQ